jgi:hypothetical protein
MPFDDPQDPQGPPSGNSLYDPILKALAAKVSQVPAQQAVLHRTATPGVFGGHQVLAPFLHELFGMPSTADSTVEGTVPPGGQALDVTDPNNNPGETPLRPSDQFMRNVRIVAATIRSAAMSPFGIPSGVGVQRAEQAGELYLANDKEKMLASIAPLLAQMGVLLPAGMLGGAGAGVGIGAEPILGSIAKGMGLGSIWGGGMSAIEEAQRPQLPGQEGTSAEQIGKAGLHGMASPENAAFGGGFGAFNWAAGRMASWLLPKMFNAGAAMSPRQAGPASTALESLSEGQMGQFVPGPGMVIDGKQAVQLKTGQIKWRTKDPTTGQWRWAKTPSVTTPRIS